MKKKIVSILSVYGIVFLMYCVLFFAIPFKKTGADIPAFLFSVLALLLGMLVVLYTAQKGETLKSKLYGFPILKLGVLYTIIQLVFGVIIWTVNSFVKVPVWLVIVLSVLWLGCMAVGVIAADNSQDIIEQMDKAAESKLTASRSFRLELDDIVNACENEVVRNALEGLAEEIRYSDPVSSEELEEIEHRIDEALNNLRELLNSKEELELQKIKELKRMVADRNRRCKLLKK